MTKLYYQTLGVREECSQEQIKKAYKKLVLKYHPDKNPNDKEVAKENFTKITEAYSVLSDPQKRAAYDNEGDSSDQARSKGRNQGYSYKWKNPEFDPNYDHFSNMPEDLKNHGMHKVFNIFDDFKNVGAFAGQSMFNSQGWFGSHFGQFTFEMAQQVFNKAFSNFDSLKMFPMMKEEHEPRSLKVSSNIESSNDQMSNPRWNKSLSEYQPKNSELIEQKVMQRGGKKIMVKTFSVTENGKTHKEVHQTIVAN